MCSSERKFVFQIAIVLRCILCMLVATSRRGIATARSKIFQKGLRTPTKLCMSSSNKDMNSEGHSALKVTSAAAVSFNRESAISGLCDFDCNILHKDLAKDTVRLLTAAKSVGVTYSIAPGTDLESSKEILDLSTSENEMQVFGSAGVHPYNAVTEAYCDDAISQLAVLLSHPNCHAVGECGLDYSSGFPVKDQQIPWFRLVTRLTLNSRIVSGFNLSVDSQRYVISICLYRAA
jgi:TatD related DNase